jgi:photosystem II stability/assembly factor-like uncharacterized protein
MTPTDAFVVGDKGTLLATRDAGKTWRPIRTTLDTPLVSVWGVGDDVYVGGDTSLVSHDRGATWQPLVARGYVLFGGTPAEVYRVGAHSMLERSTDRGATWKPATLDVAARRCRK